MKIAILGYSGCGKSTLAKYLSELYQIPVLYLDTVQFEADWKERDREEAAFMVSEFMKQESWVIDGNYTNFFQKERLAQANQIIYMEFSRWNCLVRVLHRYYSYKGQSRESMANGCMEKIDLEFVWWVLYKGRTKEKQQFYHRILEEYHKKAVFLKNQKELDAFIKKVRV